MIKAALTLISAVFPLTASAALPASGTYQANIFISGKRAVVSGSFASHDFDRNGEFSSDELIGLPQPVLSELIEQNIGQLQAVSALGELASLPAFKFRYVVRQMRLSTAASLLTAFSKYELSLAAKLLLAAKESLYQTEMGAPGPSEQVLGDFARKVLRQMLPDDSKLIVDELRKLDKKFAAEVERSEPVYSDLPAALPNPVLSRDRVWTEDFNSAVYVQQREYLIAKPDLFTSMRTSNLGPCVALILYDRITQTSILAHFDHGTYVEDSIARLMLELKALGIDAPTLAASVVGGWSGASERIVFQMFKSLQDWDVPLSFVDVLDSQGAPAGRNITVDVSTGKIKFYQEPNNSVDLPRFDVVTARNPIDGLLFRHPNKNLSSIPDTQILDH